MLKIISDIQSDNTFCNPSCSSLKRTSEGMLCLKNNKMLNNNINLSPNNFRDCGGNIIEE